MGAALLKELTGNSRGVESEKRVRTSAQKKINTKLKGESQMYTHIHRGFVRSMHTK